MDRIHLVECPRDALQGWPNKVSTEDKIAYYRALIDVGFDTIDIGSFVSPKAVPSMANTAKVLSIIEDEGMLPKQGTRILVIAANERGATEASKYETIDDIGFPLSLSETFQKRNTGASIEEAFTRLENIQNICINNSKRLVVYLSMGFGNPYGDKWHPDMLTDFSDKLRKDINVEVIALSDTVGTAADNVVEEAFKTVIKELPTVEFGAHLHLHATAGLSKIEAALRGGCLRFDGAIRGIGGCPLAQDALVGNAPTEKLIEYFVKRDLWSVGNERAWDQSQNLASEIFSEI
jgi:hydroxymethylglutaryl-CoA lyase